MRRTHLLRNVVCTCVTAAILAGTMGQGCVTFLPPTPTVRVTLTNDTAQQVQPYVWADPNVLGDPNLVSVDRNFIDVGPPLDPPPDGATIDLACTDIGSLVVDGDLLLVPDGTLPSQNILFLQQGADFFCGDQLDFFYQVDSNGGFFTSVNRNGLHLAP